MPEVTKRIVKIFAHAQALQQNGRLRSTIYCLKKRVYILNQDHTVLIEFPLRPSENPFKKPVSFSANDYDSSQFTEKDGKVIFTTSEGEYVREKSCKAPMFKPKDIRKLFNRLMDNDEMKNVGYEATLSTDFIKQLNENLSHIEFSGKDGQLVAKQRDIYAGTVITIKKKSGEGFLKDGGIGDFKPVGIRTNDLLALFLFTNTIRFHFECSNIVWFDSPDPKMPFVGILSQCIYDELGGDKK